MATCKINRGSIKVGDTVDIIRTNKRIIKATIGKLDNTTGNKVNVLLQNLTRNECEKGQLVVLSGLYSRAKNFEAKIYVLKPDEGGRRTLFKTNFQHRVIEFILYPILVLYKWRRCRRNISIT